MNTHRTEIIKNNTLLIILGTMDYVPVISYSDRTMFILNKNRYLLCRILTLAKPTCGLLNVMIWLMELNNEFTHFTYTNGEAANKLYILKTNDLDYTACERIITITTKRSVHFFE